MFKIKSPNYKSVKSQLIIVFFGVLIGMTLYEITKQLIFPKISIWESHIVTIIFTTILATVGAYFVLNERENLINQLRKAHKHLEEQVRERTSELEEANESLKESKLKFKSLADHSPDIITRYDTDLKITYINREFPVINLSRESYIGKTPDELGLNEEIAKLWIEKLNTVLKTGENQKMEYRFPRLEATRTFNTTIVPEYNDEMQITSLLTLSHNITELKKAQEHLNDTIEELRRSNDELKQFAYISSHDLQEPLRSIASFSQLLERRYKGQLDKDADEFIDFIVDAAVRMKEMIQGLLNYSRIGTKEEELENTNINNALKTSLVNLNALIEENNAIVTYDSLPTIIFNRSQMILIFQNLIGNAIKFRKPEESPKIHISFTKNKKNNEYIFSVADNSIGIESQYNDRIFQIFKRLHTNDTYKGTGIGLAIVKRIIECHHGNIWVESEFGKGSTFYFTLPISF